MIDILFKLLNNLVGTQRTVKNDFIYLFWQGLDLRSVYRNNKTVKAVSTKINIRQSLPTLAVNIK